MTIRLSLLGTGIVLTGMFLYYMGTRNEPSRLYRLHSVMREAERALDRGRV